MRKINIQIRLLPLGRFVPSEGAVLLFCLQSNRRIYIFLILKTRYAVKIIINHVHLERIKENIL